MAETVQITLTAKDGTTQVFKASGVAAEKMGDQVESAGKRGGQSLKGYEDKARSAGLAIGALGALAIRAANESEAVNLRLQQSITNTGASYDALQGRIDQLSSTALTLAFDDEDALSALANLTDATGNAKVALDDMALVMDLARARGIGLAESAKIVAAVEQGRYASLVRLGIQIDDNATRESALGELQAKYAGQAETYATSNAASWDRMGNTIENRLEGIGSHLADIQGPLIALGAASQLGLGGLATSLFGGGGAIAGVTGLAAAAAPLVVTMAALAAPIGIATYLIADQDNVMRRAAEATAANNTQLQAYLEWMGQVAGTLTPATAAIEAQGGAADKMLDFFRDTNTEALVSMDGISGFTVNMGDLRGELNNLSPENFQTVLDVARNWGVVWNDPSTWSTDGINEVAFAIVSLNNEQNTAAAVSVDMARGMAVAAYGADDFARKTETATAASAASATTMGFEIDALNALIRQREAANATALDKQENRGAEQDAYLAAERAAAERAITEGIENQALGLSVQTTDMAELKAMAVERAAAELDVAQNVLAATQAYAGMIGTTNALDAGISVVIGGLDNLGAGVEKVQTSLEGLVGVQGEWGTIDDMLAAGLITWDQYNAAVAASYSVTQDAASSQDWMNTILANQAPLLAGLVSDQENYLESLSRLPADQQLLALAYRDSAESGKALELQTLALSAVNGELGESGKQVTKDIIRGAAESSVVTRKLLEDMGVISVGAEGTIKINWPEEGQSPIDRLTAQMATIGRGLEIALRVDINDDGVNEWEPPKKEMPVDPVINEADAPAFDPVTWPVDLKINENAPPTFDPIAVAVEPEWPQFDAVQIAPPPVKVAYEYETFDPPELTNYTATIDVETATANEKIGELEQLLGTMDTATASPSVSLDTGLFDTAYSTVTANVATLDALTVSVSVSIVSAVGGKVQDITNDVGTIDGLTATIDIDGDSARWFDASNAVATSVGSVDAWSATVEIGGDGQPFWDAMNNVSISKDQVDGWNPIIEIGGDGATFWDAMNNVQVSKDQVDGWNPIVDIGADTSLYYGAVGGVALSVAAVDGFSATVDIGADTSGYYNNLPATGQTIGTNYIDVVSRPVPSGLPTPPLGFATGGVVTARMGEVGPESVVIPGSATRVIASRDGLYTVPDGSYVSPAVARRLSLIHI